MMNRAIQQLQREFNQQITQMFQLFDTRGRGYIDAGALTQGMKSLGYEIDKKQISQMIEYLDKENEKKGVITKQAFKRFMSMRMDYRDSQQQLKQAFDYYDQDGRGKITISDLKRVAEQLGQNIEQCGNIMKQTDKDQDGFLSYQQFVRVIRKTSYN